MRLASHKALALSVTAAALGFATPAIAHPEHGKPGAKVERVIIMSNRDEGGNGTPRRFRSLRIDGPDSLECDGERIAVSETTGTEEKAEKTRLVFCGKGNASPAERAQRLERALERMNGEDHLSGEHKERVIAALRAEIDRLRGAR